MRGSVLGPCHGLTVRCRPGLVAVASPHRAPASRTPAASTGARVAIGGSGWREPRRLTWPWGRVSALSAPDPTKGTPSHRFLRLALSLVRLDPTRH